MEMKLVSDRGSRSEKKNNSAIVFSSPFYTLSFFFRPVGHQILHAIVFFSFSVPIEFNEFLDFYYFFQNFIIYEFLDF